MEYLFAPAGTAFNPKKPEQFQGTLLKNDNGQYFTGKWYYMPWLIVNGDTPAVQTKVETKAERKYYVKDNVKKDIAYVLTSDMSNQMLVFNSDDVLLFKCSKDSLPELIREKQFGLIVDNGVYANTIVPVDGVNYTCNTSMTYEGAVYDKWYQIATVPLLEIKKVSFQSTPDEDGNYKISFWGEDTNKVPVEYIKFLYEDYDSFNADRMSILSYSGTYADDYKYSKTYNAKSLKKVTDENTLKNYQSYAAFNGVSFGTTTVSTDNLLWYKIETKNIPFSEQYKHEYRYYSYTITTTKTVKITDYSEGSHTLTVDKNGGSVIVTERISDSASVVTQYDYTITTNASNAEITVTTSSTNEPSLPSEISGGTEVEDFTDTSWGKIVTDYTDPAWVRDNFISKNGMQPTTATYNGIIIAPTHSGIPSADELNQNWNLVAEPTEAALYAPQDFKDLRVEVDEDGNEVYKLIIGNATENAEAAEEEDSGTEIFAAHASDMKIQHGEIAVGKTSFHYIAGEKDKASVDICVIQGFTLDPEEDRDHVGKYMIGIVTYSNYTKTKELEPNLIIWVMPATMKDSISAEEIAALNDRDITVRFSAIEAFKAKYADYLYYEYRKG